MKKILIVLALIIATTVFWIPSEGGSVSAQNRQERSEGRHHRKDHGRKYTHGYRNYGQYRRTQVGHRRFRLHRQYYRRNGIRLSRWVRIYF